MSTSPSATLLSRIAGPADVKALAPAQLPQLAQEIRDELIEVTARNGGHIGPNLGVVELTIALHRVFNTPEDQFVFDVAHQGYVHKLLTGRQGEFFAKLRKTGGASGFLYRAESKHDAFGAGHAGTALSAALGMATARDLRGSNEHVVAVCGDAAFTCGITLEAMNNVVSSTKRLIVILNDNEWSIAKNVGAISGYLNRISTSPTYNKLHHDVEAFFKSFPTGVEMNKVYNKWKRETKDFFVESSLFEKFGLRYLGPVDGHNLEALQKNLEFARHCDVPCSSTSSPKRARASTPPSIRPRNSTAPARSTPRLARAPSPSPARRPIIRRLRRRVVALRRQDPKVLGITGAMPAGTGLSQLAREVPGQFFDVGIAEEHAVLFAAGLATKGFRPVCAIYSTFLQRAYDQVIHDVALQNLPVTFCMDRAGLSPNDGPTHHGLFDLSYLRCVPNATVMQPKDEDELVDMLHTSLHLPGPGFIRYPRGSGTGAPIKNEPALMTIGQAEVLKVGTQIIIWALGSMVQDALKLAQRLEREEHVSVGVVNARFVKPLDRNLLLSQAAVVPLIVTMEDHVLAGGFGSAVIETLQEAHCPTAVERIGWPDKFVEHGSSVEILRASYGLAPDDIFKRVSDRWRSLSGSTTVDVR